MFFPFNLSILSHAHINFIADRSVNKCSTVDRLRHRDGNEVNIYHLFTATEGNTMFIEVSVNKCFVI
jgi:hypothetical protein